MTANPRVLLAEAIVLASMPTPPARSLLTVGYRGSHGRLRHHRLSRVVDGHAWHLLPCGRDEDLLCACWPALLCQHARLDVKRLGRLVLRNYGYRVVHPHWITRGLIGCLKTLDGGRANYECLLEGLRLGAELRGSGLQRYSLLGNSRDVYGGLLVEARLVVQQRDVTAKGQGLAPR